MKIYIYSEHPVLVHSFQEVIRDLRSKNIQFEIQEKNPNPLFGLRISKSGIPVFIFVGSVRAGPERLSMLNAIRKHSTGPNAPLIVIIRGTGKPKYCDSATHVSWQFPDNTYIFNIRTILIPRQVQMMIKLLFAWPHIPENHLEMWRRLKQYDEENNDKDSLHVANDKKTNKKQKTNKK